MKKIGIRFAVVFLVGAVLALARDPILKYLVIKVTSGIVGAPVTLNTFSLSLWESTLRMDGLQMGNPAGFPKGILLSVPTIRVTYDREALFKKKLHILMAEIDIQELGLIKNKEGLLNVDALAIVKRQQAKPKKSEALSFQIDLLTLKIGKIVHKDYAHGPEPSVQVHDVNSHKSYKNITSIEQLAALMIAEPVKAAGIQGAKIYGVALLTGVAILPVAAVFTFAGKDYAEQSVDESVERVYDVVKAVVKQLGTMTGQDSGRGEMKATIQGAQVVLRVQKQKDGKTSIRISARKFFLPRPAIAGGLLYQIVEKL